eukprot:scaffold576_cov260-Pinguiococcus_pyrenoidosus.AAC.66
MVPSSTFEPFENLDYISRGFPNVARRKNSAIERKVPTITSASQLTIPKRWYNDYNNTLYAALDRFLLRIGGDTALGGGFSLSLIHCAHKERLEDDAGSLHGSGLLRDLCAAGTELPHCWRTWTHEADERHQTLSQPELLR